MKIKKGMLWIGKNWEEAIKEHLKTNDCYILEVYKDIEYNSLIKSTYKFQCYKLMAYGNRFKEYRTIIPKKYYKLIENLKPNEKFKIVDNYGNKIKKEVLK